MSWLQDKAWPVFQVGGWLLLNLGRVQFQNCSAETIGYQPTFHTKLVYFGWWSVWYCLAKIFTAWQLSEIGHLKPQLIPWIQYNALMNHQCLQKRCLLTAIFFFWTNLWCFICRLGKLLGGGRGAGGSRRGCGRMKIKLILYYNNLIYYLRCF